MLLLVKVTYNFGIYAGKNSFMWIGPMPRVHIMDPEQLKTVFSLINDYQKPTASLNPLAKLLADGLLNHEGQKWVKHRKIINPAFHLEKLKVSSFSSISLFNYFKINFHKQI